MLHLKNAKKNSLKFEDKKADILDKQFCSVFIDESGDFEKRTGEFLYSRLWYEHKSSSPAQID